MNRIRTQSFLRHAAVAVLFSVATSACPDDPADPTTPQADIATDIPADASANDSNANDSNPNDSADTQQDTPEPGDTSPDTLIPDTPNADSGPDVSDDTGTDTGNPPEGCAPLAELSSGTCEVTAGDASTFLIEGDLVLSDGIQTAGQLLVVNGTIACVGCDCAAEPAAASATRITCPKGIISPGLINAHDHISWAQDTPKDPGLVRYDHRHEWRKGKNGKPSISTTQNPDALGDAWGEMRQVLSGTTSLFGSGGEGGFLRNLDRGDKLEGLNQPDGDYSTFPLGDSGGTLYSTGCGSYSPDDPTQAASESAYVPHVAEGIIDAARNEFICVSGDQSITDAVDFTNDNAAFIHGIGVTTADIGLMAAEGTALIWSPRSNTVLYGMTANAQVYKRLGALIALGTDWTPSGSIHVLRELACAESWNGYWDNAFTEAELIDMVTINAAEALGFANVLGSLTVGKVADIAIFDGSINSNYRAILDAETSDVALVMRGGQVLYGDAAVVEATTTAGDCETLDVCGTPKRICAQRELGVTVATLDTQLAAGTYDLIFCGAPQDEPTCMPWRPDEFDGVPTADDNDGDGIANADDNCPDVFNPIRPIDGGTQNDADSDDVGDECDPCPFDPNTTACSSVDPLDIDGDGIPIPTDNCPGVSNPDQDDFDEDGIGDLCDPCPSFKNPGGSACPGSIYDVKKGVITLGSAVLIPEGLVTAVGNSFFTMQVDPVNTDAYDGAEYSGLYVYYPGGDGLPAVGDRIEVSGTVNDFFGQTQLEGSSWTLLEAGAGAPDPLVIGTSELATGTGATSDAYEALLVTVENVTVINTAPTGQNGETVSGEFEVTDGLPVDDQLFLLDPFPTVDQAIPAITGVIRYTWNRNKLLPRNEADYDLGAAYLLSFGPNGSVVWDQQTDVATIPELVVTLNTSASSPLFVPVTSDAAGLTVVDGGVTIAAGSNSGVVRVTTTAPAAGAVLTATLDDVSLTATVDVLDLTTPVEVTALDPASATVAADGEATFTVTLSQPAPPSGQTVTIAAAGVALTTVPTEVVVEAGSTTATFTVIAGQDFGTADITASIGASSQTATLEVADVPPVGLLLVEVFYNSAGGDSGNEWIKLYNGTGADVDLSGYSLGWGGTSYTYGTAQLQGTVAAGECFIVGGPNSTEASFNVTYDQELDFANDLQNSGSTADGVALFDVLATAITSSTVPIDAVIYGGTNSSGLIDATGSVGTVDVGDAGTAGSIVRTGIDSWDINATPDSGGCIVVTP